MLSNRTLHVERNGKIQVFWVKKCPGPIKSAGKNDLKGLDACLLLTTSVILVAFSASTATAAADVPSLTATAVE